MPASNPDNLDKSDTSQVTEAFRGLVHRTPSPTRTAPGGSTRPSLGETVPEVC